MIHVQGEELDFCDSCVSLPAQVFEGDNPACITSAHCPQLFKDTILHCRAGMQGKWPEKAKETIAKMPS